MTVETLLHELTRRGIELITDNGKIIFDAPAGAMTAEDREAISAHKAELVDYLRNESDYAFLARTLTGQEQSNLIEQARAAERAGKDRAAAEDHAVRHWMQRYRERRLPAARAWSQPALIPIEAAGAGFRG